MFVGEDNRVLAGEERVVVVNSEVKGPCQPLLNS
jgi:hypothetical protein